MEMDNNGSQPWGGEESNFQSCHIIDFKMFSLQQELWGVQINKKNGPCTGEKQSLEIVPGKVQTLALADRNFKSAPLSMFKEQKWLYL